MHDKEPTLNDYCSIIARNILSGQNACGTLQNAIVNNDRKYFEEAAKPVVGVIMDERNMARMEALRQSAMGNDVKGALEMVAQNIGGSVKISDVVILNVLEHTLGRKLK